MVRPDFQRIGNIIPARSTVLDMGCGDGDLLDYLIHEKEVEGQGIELSTDGIRACVEKGINVVQGDIAEALENISQVTFDYIILSQTLHELPKPDEIILDALRVGKHVIVSFFNLAFFKYRLSLLFKGTFPKDFPYSWKNTYASILTLKDFRAYCEEHGIGISYEILLDQYGKEISTLIDNWRTQVVVLVLQRNRKE
ncbi:MAG: methyltransferase domain-containing protein [Candidatus Lokiarchaeota archaeon]|nr:methyltransferase domain-containing protein [Candidatus Lokiarchaeota archaeon]